MAEKKTYAGSIKNQGTQVVESLYSTQKAKGKTIVKTGDDLRNGSKK